jgi:hypothetical protein
MRWMVPALMLGMASAEAAEPAPPVELDYLVTTGGLPVLRFDYRLTATDAAYRVDFTAETLGVVDWFAGLRLTASDSGRIAAGTLVPELYRSQAETNDGPRRTDIDYLPDGQLRFEAVPSSASIERKKLTPLVPDSLPGTIDPLAGVLDLSRLVASGAGCTTTIPIFDGRHRYNFVLAHAGWDLLPRAEGHAFDGTAERCLAHVEKLGGYPVEPSPEPDRPATIWIARPAADEPPIMVEFAAEGRWGVVRGRLTRFRHGTARADAAG